MSHTATIQTQVTDLTAITTACKEMGLPLPVHQDKVHFGGTVQSGICVKLPGWHYPVVIDLKTGSMKYDNYGGAWGAQEHLSKFMQTYGVAKASAIARAKGYMVQRTTLTNGSVRLTVTV